MPGKHWRLKYRVDGKEKRLSFGPWPAVSLQEARDKRDDAKRLLRESRDPGMEKKRPIAQVTPQDVLTMLRKIEERRAFETASRVIGFCSLIFKYAISLGLVDADPCRDLRPALKPYTRGQLAAITKPKEVGALIARH